MFFWNDVKTIDFYMCFFSKNVKIYLSMAKVFFGGESSDISNKASFFNDALLQEGTNESNGDYSW